MFALASVGAVVGVVVLCGAVLAGCGGLLAVFSPVNYFGCGTERPTGITAADLAASYATADGGRLELIADSTVSASGLTNWETWDSSEQDQDPPLSGPGTWSSTRPTARQATSSWPSPPRPATAAASAHR